MLHTQNILIAAVTGESLQWAGGCSSWKKVRTAGQLTQHLSIAIPIMVSLFNNLLASKTSPFLKIVAGTTLSAAGLGVLGLAVSPIAPDLGRSGLLGDLFYNEHHPHQQATIIKELTSNIHKGFVLAHIAFTISAVFRRELPPIIGSGLGLFTAAGWLVQI